MNNRLKCVSILIACVMAGFCLSSCGTSKPDKLTYSVYPYLIDTEYYRECVEEAWYEIHPDIELEPADYDCYFDGSPEGIDVIMYDAVLESTFIAKGYIQPIDENDIDNQDDFFGYTIEDIISDGKIYGIPAICCGDFFIYDMNDEIASNAENLYDLADLSGEILINASYINYGMMVDAGSDIKGSYTIETGIDNGEELIDEIRNITSEEYYDKLAYELAEIYDSGVGKGYIGYSETLSTLNDRISNTGIKMLSYSESDNVVLLYEDVVGLSSSVEADKKEYCLELMNVMCSSDLMSRMTQKDGNYNYLIFPRNSAYSNEIKGDELYGTLYEIVSDEDNHIIRLPAGEYYQ